MHATLPVPAGYEFAASVGQLTQGRWDPVAHMAGGVFRLAAQTPDGPGVLELRLRTGEIRADGDAWLVERAAAIAGLHDDVSGFADLARAHPLVDRLAKVHHGLRMPATGLVFGRLIRAICEQKVTGKEAHRSYAGIIRRWGTRLDEDLWAPPAPEVIREVPYYEMHSVGLEQRRADTLRRAAAIRLSFADRDEAVKRLMAVPGIGVWTVAEVTRDVYGDADAVSVGDFHIKNQVAWALAGEPRATDERMLELLEPFRGHRGRVCALLTRAGISAPRYGPRASVRTHI